MDKVQSIPAFKLGDRVKIRLSNGMRGRIVELRGPLGPGGAQIYRVRVKRSPDPRYLEVREDQLILIPPKASKPAGNADSDRGSPTANHGYCPVRAAGGESTPAFKLGDRVKLRHSGGQRGRIVELHGPLGPGGMQIYRVRVKRWPEPRYIDMREDQLVLIPPKE